MSEPKRKLKRIKMRRPSDPIFKSSVPIDSSRVRDLRGSTEIRGTTLRSLAHMQAKDDAPSERAVSAMLRLRVGMRHGPASRRSPTWGRVHKYRPRYGDGGQSGISSGIGYRNWRTNKPRPE